MALEGRLGELRNACEQQRSICMYSDFMRDLQETFTALWHGGVGPFSSSMPKSQEGHCKPPVVKSKHVQVLARCSRAYSSSLSLPWPPLSLIKKSARADQSG